MLPLPRKRAPHFSDSFSLEEKRPPGTVWVTDTSHLTVVTHRGYRYLQHFCCAISHAHLINPMRNLSADSFVEAVTYICDHVKQRQTTIAKTLSLCAVSARAAILGLVVDGEAGGVVERTAPG